MWTTSEPEVDTFSAGRERERDKTLVESRTNSVQSKGRRTCHVSSLLVIVENYRLSWLVSRILTEYDGGREEKPSPVCCVRKAMPMGPWTGISKKYMSLKTWVQSSSITLIKDASSDEQALSLHMLGCGAAGGHAHLLIACYVVVCDVEKTTSKCHANRMMFV